jgi:RNA polymerase sigma factor (sigma-70 family)
LSLDIESLYSRFGPLVHRRCRALLRDEQLASEAMHDTFMSVMRRQDGLVLQAPWSFLHRVATNVCLNQLRRMRRRPEDANDELVLRIAAAPDETERPFARLLLGQIFAREQPSTRTIAVLHLLDGFTLQQVADEVGMSVAGVRKRLAKLREHIQELEERSP